jgi:hypothetical protein
MPSIPEAINWILPERSIASSTGSSQTPLSDGSVGIQLNATQSSDQTNLDWIAIFTT